MDSQQDLTPAFVEFVMIQAQQASLFLGQISPGEGQEPIIHLELAKKMIDQLAMIRTKTKGNLTPDEEKFLDSVLSDLRLGFVQASNKQASQTTNPAAQVSPETPQPENKATAAEAIPEQPAAEETNPEVAPEAPKAEDHQSEESKKRFTKNYG